MRSHSCALIALVLSMAQPSLAGGTSPQYGTSTDVAPGSTLLLPYFEVGLDDASQDVNTTFIINNADGGAFLHHVMLFTDYGVGTFAFDVYLTGYDVQSFDLGELFRGTAELDGGRALSLAEDTPVETPPAPPASEVFADSFETGTLERWDGIESRIDKQSLQAYHTGGTSQRYGLCAGVDHGDGIARGYVLIDATEKRAGGAFPDEPGYFGDDGIADIFDRLRGDYEIRNPANNVAFSNPMVHLEADQDAAGARTFYAHYSGGEDYREPLETTWATRYMNGGAFTAGTHVMYWRDIEQVQEPFPCGNPPDWSPLPHKFITTFDEAGNATEVEDVTPFGYACGIVEVGSEALPTPADFGWLFADFNAVSTYAGAENQAVILATFGATGRFSVGQYGIPFDSAPSLPTDVFAK